MAQNKKKLVDNCILCAKCLHLLNCFIPALVPRNGAWGDWSSWTVCDKLCDGGKRKRHRFCDNPFPLHGGADCSEKRHETEDCNTQSCPSEFKSTFKTFCYFLFSVL